MRYALWEVGGTYTTIAFRFMRERREGKNSACPNLIGPLFLAIPDPPGNLQVVPLG